MFGRRFLIIVAVLMGLTALAASVAPRDPTPRERATATPSPTPTSQAAAEVPADAGTVERMIDADAETPQRVVIAVGEIVQLEVAGSEVDSVMLMDEIDVVDPDSNARFNVLADETGDHEIRLLDADRVIGTLAIVEADQSD